MGFFGVFRILIIGRIRGLSGCRGSMMGFFEVERGMGWHMMGEFLSGS